MKLALLPLPAVRNWVSNLNILQGSPGISCTVVLVVFKRCVRLRDLRLNNIGIFLQCKTNSYNKKLQYPKGTRFPNRHIHTVHYEFIQEEAAVPERSEIPED